MNTTVVCTEVRPAAGSPKECVVVASLDESENVKGRDSKASSNLAEVRDRLRAQGIVLGGPLQAAERHSTQSSLALHVQIIAHDENGKVHRLFADLVDEYRLSSGSTLFYFSVAEAPGDCRWLVNRTLEVAEEAHEYGSVEDIRETRVNQDAI